MSDPRNNSIPPSHRFKMDNPIRFETDVPIPQKRRAGGRPPSAEFLAVEALAASSIGDSVFFQSATRTTISVAANHIGGKGWASVRFVEGDGQSAPGVRIWKIAEPTK